MIRSLVVPALLALAIACSPDDPTDDWTRYFDTLEALAMVGSNDFSEFDAHGDPAAARAEVLEQLEADGVATDGAEDALATLAFGDSRHRGRALGVLHLLDPERAYREALKAADDTAAIPSDPVQAQGRAFVIAYGILSGEPSHETAIDRGFALLESARPEQRFIGHVLLTIVTLKNVPPDPFEIPHLTTTLAAIGPEAWRLADVVHPGEDVPMLIARAVAARSRGTPARMSLIHAKLGSLLIRVVPRERIATLFAQPVEAAAIRDELSALTFTDLNKEFAPNRM